MTTFEIGQTVWQAEGQWSNGREIDDLSEVRATKEEAIADADSRLRFLGGDEQSRVRSMFVRAYTVTHLDDDGSPSMTSLHDVHHIIGG